MDGWILDDEKFIRKSSKLPQTQQTEVKVVTTFPCIIILFIKKKVKSILLDKNKKENGNNWSNIRSVQVLFHGILI